jgi:BirA family biotin operon repressor/biotin-[acetyl-CoA-carboxylase] ligase
MTKAERLLWSRIRNRQIGVKFQRQQPLGNYIVDFASFELSLIIEIDGGQHMDCLPDRDRDLFLKKAGFEVLRFWNNEVLGNIEGVLEVIESELLPSL